MIKLQTPGIEDMKQIARQKHGVSVKGRIYIPLKDLIEALNLPLEVMVTDVLVSDKDWDAGPNMYVEPHLSIRLISEDPIEGITFKVSEGEIIPQSNVKLPTKRISVISIRRDNDD